MKPDDELAVVEPVCLVPTDGSIDISISWPGGGGKREPLEAKEAMPLVVATLIVVAASSTNAPADALLLRLVLPVASLACPLSLKAPPPPVRSSRSNAAPDAARSA